MQWFRVYNEILDDPKIAKMDGDTFRCFFYLLARRVSLLLALTYWMQPVNWA